MSNGIYSVGKPENEPVYSYEPGSKERQEVQNMLKTLQEDILEIPVVIGGKKYYTGNKKPCIVPHNHNKVIGYYHEITPELLQEAIDTALAAKAEWEAMPFKHKAGIFLRAAELLATTWRARMNAATMLTQSKSVHQAEIDAVCELIDFLKFNAYYMEQILQGQPSSNRDIWNRMDYTGLDGFVYAVSPFNFTSIGGNLAAAPALAGNVVLWKPASTAVYSNYVIMQLFEEAGLPKGVINFIPGQSQTVTDIILDHEKFSGFHYTGSTKVFSSLWTKIGMNINKYSSYPRLVGETGGKNFIFAHESADIRALAIAMVRGGFEYQGQKCSAASRVYIPESIWPTLEPILLEEIKTIKMGDVEDFGNFMNAVIDQKSYDRITGYINAAKESDDTTIIAGGNGDDSKGYFVEPTVILSKTTDSLTMREEIFGPVLTVYVYPNEAFEATLKTCEETSPYALTGAIFAKDRSVVNYMEQTLKCAAGNFYINDKPTGAVVGQQPFGGARASGTNDKAGSHVNLYRWMNARVVKENFKPVYNYEYPFMK